MHENDMIDGMKIFNYFKTPHMQTKNNQYEVLPVQQQDWADFAMK